MSTGSGAALVGRVDELERLRECYVRTAQGTGTLVLLDGDAGAGKTRLLAEAAKAPFLPRGCTAVTAAALDYARAPYAPVRDLLLALDKRFPKVLAHNAALASALRPVLELKPLDTEAEDPGEQRRMLDAVIAALQKYAASGPILLAVEDVHWIDRASADVLIHTARNLSALRAMLVVSYRGGDASERAESRDLIAQLSRSASLTLGLKPLSLTDSMLLIEDVVPSKLPISVRRNICELGQGNPLLLIELARHVAEDPSVLEGTLPLSLHALVNERLSRFDDGDRDVLRVCAAMDSFEPGAVAEIAGVPVQTVMGTLRKARAAAIVVESPGARDKFLFRHALIRRAITDELLGIELADLHARIALRLESQQDSGELHARLAYHYWMAGDRVKSQRFNAMAAREAVAVYAYDDAAILYERAIDRRPVDGDTYDMYLALAQTYASGGRYRQAVENYRHAFAHAREHRTVHEAAQIGIALSRCCFHALDDDGSITAAQNALTLVDPDADPELAFELYGLIGWHLIHRRRIDEADEALQKAQPLHRYGSAVAQVRYHEARAAHEVHARGGGRWREEIEAALTIAQELEPNERLRRYLNAIALSVASEIDSFDVALDLIRRCEDLVAAEASLDHNSFLATAARIYLPCGQLSKARTIVEQLLPYVNDAPQYAAIVASVGIPLALRTGDEMLLHACARPRLLHDAFASKRPQVFGHVSSAVAEHMLAQGRVSEAAALVERTLHRLTDAGNNFDLLILAARLGSEAIAERAAALLEPWLSRSRSARASMALLRAYRSKGLERVEFAKTAAHEFEQLAWPLHRARALELCGESESESALNIYRECGAAADVVRLSSRKQSASASVLSKREVEVAGLVAEGNSNRAIAEKLVLSERTVENHIASVFSKLNVRSRAEIAAFVARENAPRKT